MNDWKTTHPNSDAKMTSTTIRSDTTTILIGVNPIWLGQNCRYAKLPKTKNSNSKTMASFYSSGSRSRVLRNEKRYETKKYKHGVNRNTRSNQMT